MIIDVGKKTNPWWVWVMPLHASYLDLVFRHLLSAFPISCRRGKFHPWRNIDPKAERGNFGPVGVQLELPLRESGSK